MRTLIFCPTRRLEPETIEAIHGQVGDGIDFMFTRDNPYHQENETDIDRFGWAGKQNILHNYNKGRKVALDGGYDQMFILESDIIAPPDALAKLSAIAGDVCFGAYMFRSGTPVVNIARDVVNGGWPDVSYSFHPRYYEKVWGQVTRCTGLGFGCTLIRRNVLEAVPFRVDEDAHCDYLFCEDALKAGFRFMADFSVLCGHKRPDGVILWPTLKGWRETQGHVRDEEVVFLR